MSAFSPLHLFLISDSYNHSQTPEEQKGGTTRLLARTMQEAARLCGGTFTPLGADKERDAIKAIRNDGRTVTAFVRCQTKGLVEAFDDVRAGGIPTLIHGADPHILNFTANPEDDSTKRKDLQTYLYTNASAVIAPTDALGWLFRPLNTQTHVIPNVVDATRFYAPMTLWKDEPTACWQAASSMYSLHAPGVNLIVDGLESLNAAAPRLALDIETAIKKKPSEIKTHASADQRDHAQELLLRAAQHSWLNVTEDFSVRSLDIALKTADFYLIPADPLVVMSPYQRLWRAYRGMDRAAMALAYGLLPVAQKQEGLKGNVLAPSMTPLLKKGALVVFDTVPDMVRKLETLSAKALKAKIDAGQAYVQATRSLDVVAKRHLRLYNEVLGR